MPAPRMNVRAGLLVALAVFAQESVWNFYDAQVPASLGAFTASAAVIGLLMGLDNVLGIFIQPLMGFFSDNLRSRFGRRMPFVMVGVPIAAVLFALIPFAESLWSLVTVMFLFAVTANAFKGITLSLTPDFQPAGQRSRANSLVQIAGSLTVIVSALISLFVADEDLKLAFAIPAVLMVAATAVVVFTLKETKSPGYLESVAESAAVDRIRLGYRTILGGIVRDRDKSRVAILVVTFVAAASWAAVRAQLTPYVIDQLDLTRGAAGSLVLPAGVGFLIAALPVAMISDRFGRRLITKIGLAVFAAGCLLAFVTPTVESTIIGVVISSIGFTAFAVNGVVILWNLAPSPSVMGMYTAIYAVIYAMGSAIGPGFIGLLVDISDWRFFMVFAAGMGVLAFALLFTVKRENAPSPLDNRGLDAARER